MSKRVFDEKFGADLLNSVPTGPGVYRYLNAERIVIYVGKAKNLRRRLQGYRNATRKKVHRKMVRVVRRASHLSYETVASEADALLLENQLIRDLKPELNVEGAYSFLYPALGLGQNERQMLLCMTTQPEQYASLGLSWYGSFRSRLRTKLAFSALVDLLGLVGHAEKRAALPSHPRLRGSRFIGLRQVPAELADSLPRFFAGEDASMLSYLARLLLSKPRARRDASEVEEKLIALRDFFQTDAAQLRAALIALDQPGTFVSAEERDGLFIRARFQSEV
jgi:hypothetical protein